MSGDYTPVIPKTELVHGAYYHGRCRNAVIARWNGEKQRFYHWRHKFGMKFVEDIKAPEDDQYFDVFVAERLIIDDAEITEEIPFEEGDRDGL